MRKIEAIIDLLHDEYDFNHDVSAVKAWWKIGGKFPFVENETKHQLVGGDSLSQERFDKLQFLVTYLMTKELGDTISDVPTGQLVSIKDIAVQFALDFSDPNKAEVSEEYLKTFIKGILSSD